MTLKIQTGASINETGLGLKVQRTPKTNHKSNHRTKTTGPDQTKISETSDMEQIQMVRSLLLLLLVLPQCLSMPLGGQCVDETFCSYNLQEYYSQMVNLPSHINERSIASWSYVQNIDLNRVPQVIHEASCHTSHSCRGLDGSFGLETIPVSLRMPVLKKNPNCFPTASYSMEFELITVACLCAISRNN